jgi:hypothetical protein
MGHVSRNIGGYYETAKSVEQTGDVFEVVPKVNQKDALNFIQKQLFETPRWMLDGALLNKFSSPVGDQVSSLQDNVLSSLLSSARLGRFATMANRYSNSYDIDEYFTDLKKGIFSELATHSKIDNNRRNLQKSYVERMIAILNPSASSGATLSMGFGMSAGPDLRKTDVSSVTRAHLVQLKSELSGSANAFSDKMSKYHVQDLTERIRQALDPK